MLRLAGDGISREIARTVNVARSTIQDYLRRAKAAGLTWPLPDELTDDVLQSRLFASVGTKRVSGGGPSRIGEHYCELKRPGVTLHILWEEYRAVQPEGYGYSRFCDLISGFQKRLSPVMRQEHVAGDKLFVDYSGKKVPIIDRTTGEIREAELFVGVLGASTYTYAEVTWTQQKPDWIACMSVCCAISMGCPDLVPDNLKSGVNKASFYDPEINRNMA
jgi:transposase